MDESKPFCGNCSRLRLTCKGKLRACLMSERGENIRGVRKGNEFKTEQEE